MISKLILDQAKMFLSWDTFNDLSIKLVPIDRATAFFYPPTQNLSTIIVFYEKNNNDYLNPLLFLFHEAGHFEQYRMYKQQNIIHEFWSLINLDKGDEKIKFERNAWNIGKQLMKIFIEKYQLNNSGLLDQYQNMAGKCLVSYY